MQFHKLIEPENRVGWGGEVNRVNNVSVNSGFVMHKLP